MHAHALPNRFGYSKTYLSVAESRRWSVEHPVGDPHGGAAYGEKRMPVAAIAAMVVGGIMAESAIVAGLYFAGAAISTVGLITGNATLSMIGGVVGMAAGGFSMFGAESAAAGGLGPTATEAAIDSGSLGGGASVADAAAASPVAGMTGGDALQQAGNLPEVGAVGNGQGGLINSSTNLAQGSSVLDSAGSNFNSILGTDGNALNIGANGPLGVDPVAGVAVDAGAAPGATGATESATGSTYTPSTDSSGVPKVLGSETVSPGTPAFGADGYSTLPDAELAAQIKVDGQNIPGYDSAGNYTGKTGSMSSAPPSAAKDGGLINSLKGVGQFAKENKELLDYGGNILKSYGESDLRDAQQKYLEAKSNNDDAQAEYYRAKIAEMQRLAANANARGSNQLGTAGAISPNGSAYSNNPTRATNALSFGKA